MNAVRTPVFINAFNKNKIHPLQNCVHFSSTGGAGKGIPWGTLPRCVCQGNVSNEDRIAWGQNTGMLFITTCRLLSRLNERANLQLPYWNSLICKIVQISNIGAYFSGLVSESSGQVEEAWEVLGTQQCDGRVWALRCHGPPLHPSARINHQLRQERDDGLLCSLASRWASRLFALFII